MSRLGKTSIIVPKGVEVSISGNKVTAKGPKGSLSHELVNGLSAVVENGEVKVSYDANSGLDSKFYGLHRALIKNIIEGVSKGFEVRLNLIGVGYRAAVVGTKVDLQLGFSHPVQLPIPKGVTVAIDKSVNILITGSDRQVVGQFAATIRSKKPPEPYKGKGIRYENEVVRKKAGKAAKGKGA
jgi:large subunit ribosomal protein L6